MEYNHKIPSITLLENTAVVIIGRNEGDRLDKCIKSVLKSGAKYIIYVDSHSNDGSVALAKGLNVDVVELDNEKPLSAARARNEGVDSLMALSSSIDYIHFIDGDCELDVNWLPKAIVALNNLKDVAVVCGRLREKHREQTIFNKLSDIGWYIPPGEVESAGGIATIRASVFLNNKGFNDKLIAGEEPEFYLRLRQAGHKILSLKDNMATHDAAMTSYSEWWTRTVRTGFSYANAKEWDTRENKSRSLIIWGGLYPLLLGLSPLINLGATAALIILFFLQIFKIFLNLNIPYSKKDKFLYACVCMLDKFPEFLGFLKYQYAKMSGTRHQIIEYKK